jgi:hypothetical protein
MSKVKDNEVAVQRPRALTLSTAPSFLQKYTEEHGAVGLENAQAFIKPPRLKIIQKAAQAPYSDTFNTGDVVMVPQMALVAPIMVDEKGKSGDRGAPFHFVPLFFFPEWCLWNPIQTKGQLDAIRNRSFDKSSILAQKSRDPNSRAEPCPEAPQFMMKYQEHLNFVLMILGDNECAGTPVIQSFFRGEHRTGSTLLSVAKMRKAPMFGQIFEATSTYRPGSGKGDWYGLDITAPSMVSGLSSWVTDAGMFAAYEKMHEELKKAHADNAIVVDMDDLDDSTYNDSLANNPDKM